ncbi:MAG: CHRD domain-containing protein, partial [Natronosporangium sp.]
NGAAAMRPRSLGSVLVLPVLVLTTATSPASAGPRVGEFQADPAPLNQDGQATVTLRQRGTQLTVQLQAAGLDDGVHLAHIHGVRQTQNTCPTLAADADGNGVVDFAEGLPAYGGVQRTVSNGTDDRGTSLAYTREFTQLDSGAATASIGSLDQYAFVVHGVDLDGDGAATNPDVDGDGPDPDDNEISMPALCGVVGSTG